MAKYKVPILSEFEWQAPVLDKDLSAPPGAPSKGDRYIIGPSATGAWSGHDGDIAEYNGASWDFTTKKEGLFTFVKDEDKLYRYITSWAIFGGGGGTTFIGLTDTPAGIEYGHVWGNIAKNALLFSGNKHPDMPPTTPETEDDEFNNEAIDGKWTITNNPGAPNAMSESKHPGNVWVGLIELGTDNFDNLVRLHQTPPAGNQTLEFQAKVCISQTGGGGNRAEWATIGIYLGNSVQDQYISAEIQFNDYWGLHFVTKINGGEDNGSGACGVMANHYEQFSSTTAWVYLRLVKTTANAYNAGNTYRAYFSYNGLIWFEVGHDTKTFTTNCNEVGFYFRRPKSQTNTPHVEALIDWFRRMD